MSLLDKSQISLFLKAIKIVWKDEDGYKCVLYHDTPIGMSLTFVRDFMLSVFIIL